ncbi:ATP-binding protein [Kitasatospora sp. NBC_00240]|uniref:ATP-binding protein n=1 Tax=Kitasatospora sp. NBC_00240 TaxID=2903567 RepID=UPI00225B40D0|nr:ATP-binding protein [Kitasatospora sp. NBC_00240]MCX5216194.1 ATP-binding protein [Kitasatospora sp. NBC_00240]
MRLPVRHISGHLLWTTNAAVWGVWKVDTENYSHASHATKRARLDALEALFKSLRGEALLLSLCPQVDAASVVTRMTAGVDLDQSPEYVDLSLRVLDQLENLELTGRVDFLALPLPHLDVKQTAKAVLSSVQVEVMSSLGLPVAPVSAAEETSRLQQARRIAATWPAGIKLRPATEAEILWIYGHSARRGIDEPLLPEEGAPRALRGRGRTVTAHTQVILDEGGRSDREGKGPTSPWRRRYLKAETEHGASYQAFSVLSEMPESFVFPGSEYLAVLDDFSFPVDWAVRMHVESGAKAEPRSRRQQRELANQRGEYEGETAGAPASLDKASISLDEYRERLTSSATEVEIRASIATCVWGENPDEANEKAQLLANHFGGNEYTLVRPIGDQVALFHAMLPGTRTPRPLLDYTQFMLARDFAMSMPYCGSSLGDDAGSLFGLQLSGGGVRPVLTDFSHGPRVNASASAAFVGELGSGKSVAMKSAMFSILTTGRRSGNKGSRGRALVIDRTPQQEWSRFALACPGTTQIINVDERAGLSLDPLRVFRGPRAARYTESFLTPLLDIASMSVEGITLAEAIEATRVGPQPSMSALIETLAQRARTQDPEEPNDSAVRAAASEVVRKLRALAKKDLGKVIFDPSLPVVQITNADSIVFAVDRLGLPTKEDLSEHRLPTLEVEKRFGWRLMYLMTALCREVAFADPNDFTAVILDECWWLTSSAEGSNLLLEIIADGRKHNAGAFAGSHDPYDIGPKNEIGDKIRALLSHIYVFRHRGKALAKRCLEFLDLDPNDAEMVKLITENLSPINLSDTDRLLRSGECLYRDLRKRVGAMKVLIPADEAAAEAIHTTPGQGDLGLEQFAEVSA